MAVTAYAGWYHLRRRLHVIRKVRIRAVTLGLQCYYHHPTYTIRSRDEGLMHGKQILLRSIPMTINRSAPTARETSTAVTVIKSASELQDQIRRRAYELYEQRGSNDGHEVSDWLQAESEVAQKKKASAPRTDREHGAHLL